MQRTLTAALTAAVIAAVPQTGASQTGPRPPTGFPAACAPGEVRVMLLGTYHMENPGADVFNTRADDVLAPKRQAELEALATRLARFRPQQIAVEAPLGDSAALRTAYGRFRASPPGSDRSETAQVAFRLAHRLGHGAVYPIDYPMPLESDSIGALYGRRPDLKRLGDSIQGRLGATVDSSNALLRRVTITGYLRRLNSEAGLHGGNSYGMFGSFMAAGEGANYGGPDLIARWYERNIRMVHHLHRVLQPGTERVLVVVGAGHVPPMRNLLDEDPRFCPVSPLAYLR
jgi:hypothetical protein